MSLRGLEKFLHRDSLSQIVINHGSRGGWIEVSPRTEVKIRQVTLRLIRLLHECVDNLRRTRLICEVISCDKKGTGRLHISETFPTFFLNRNMGCCYCCFWREKDEWRQPGALRQLMDTTEKRAINWTETRLFTASIITYQFFLRAWVSVSLVPRRSLLIRCFREVSVTPQLMVESRNDRAENAWGLGWVSVLSWI